MKLFSLLIVPMIVFAATRQECAQMLERFAPLERSYDAVVESGVAAPVSEQVIKEFRHEGARIYGECKDKMSTTRWYMLGKKIKPYGVDLAKYHMPSVAELKRYAINNPPVITEVRCGTIKQGIHPLPRKAP
jgi:hypothetical protein